jgi:DNA invertase Pin-like site-specific DNA recombinase
MNAKLTPERLLKKAIVYVRQSTASQLIHNQESQRLQYGLVDRARTSGFQNVIVIDEDLGRTGSGLVERPGFQRLLAEVCSGDVGAVFCLEASRLARNGRDWHHLIELCAMLGAVLVDPDGVYDPILLNDRLLLGLRGTMSEFELNLFRQRSIQAIRQKARRGELRIPLPIGFLWSSSGKIEKDPDERVREAIDLVFRKMTEWGSIRQVLIWLRHENVSLPVLSLQEGEPQRTWKLPFYKTIHAILTNPTYAGAYAFGKTETRTRIVEGYARKSTGHPKPRSEWMVLIRDHHPGYIGWEEYERNQAMIAANTYGHSGSEPKSGRGGRALLSGLLRCRRCGRMLYVAYGGLKGVGTRYWCRGQHIDCGEGRCISFGGLRVEEAISKELLCAIEGNAIEAAFKAAAQVEQRQQELRRAVELEVEQARYEARLAGRRYEAVDPEQRLVAKELEARWNVALQKVQDLEKKLHRFDNKSPSSPLPNIQVLMSLAQDLPAVWNSPSTDMRLKQRIVRILIREVIADIDENSREIVLLIHWAGGRHSELRFKKSETGKHRHCTSLDAIDTIHRMAGKFPDEQIAATLNRLQLRTGAGNTWNELRVYSVRRRHRLPAYDPNQCNAGEVNLEQAAQRLNLSPPSVRKLIEQKILPAYQVVECAPWQIPVEALDTDVVQKAAANLRNRVRVPRSEIDQKQQSMFSDT